LVSESSVVFDIASFPFITNVPEAIPGIVPV
jgi:hypothetical protein